VYAITISQPFASLIASGEKWVENRHWATPYRGPLAIHAGRGTQYLSRNQLRRYTTGAIVAVVELGTVVLVDYARECLTQRRCPHSWVVDRFTIEDLERFVAHEHTEGPYGWVLSLVEALAEPIPCRGAQRLWEVPSAIAAKLP
jgi:hypothetical protein